MAEFILSAFADEAAEGLDEQLEALAQENIRMIELRGVDGVNCSELGVEDAVRIHKSWRHIMSRFRRLARPMER